jgi:pyruvate formate lyase activating enzyme
MSRVKILGQVKSSFIDYPGKLCTTIFLAGCNMKCGYCHNPDIVHGEGPVLQETDFFDFLDRRRKYLDGVCVSGGEPTLYHELPKFIEDIKARGYTIKLDTNGTNPTMLKKLIEDQLIDYVAMDIKGPLYKYSEITGIQDFNTIPILESIHLLKQSDIQHEFRTTITRELLGPDDIKEVVMLLDFPKRYALQNFRKAKNILGNRLLTSYSLDELDKIKETITNDVDELIIR